jgi:type I restriction enzyme M protein
MASSATDSSGKDRALREKLVKSGHVDAMLYVGNNFFYTKSLPCTLWFLDKGKPQELRRKVLFIDAQSYHTAIDTTHNEWSPWQLKNLSAIVWLYRGEAEKYYSLLDEYCEEIRGMTKLVEGDAKRVLAGVTTLDDFAAVRDALAAYVEGRKAKAKAEVDAAKPRERKRLRAAYDEEIAGLEDALTVVGEALWLTDKFGSGEYADIPGLCKVATLQEIEEKNWSLTPGAHVGVPPQEDDGIDFHERMGEIHEELLRLQAESNELMATISRNFEELGL